VIFFNRKKRKFLSLYSTPPLNVLPSEYRKAGWAKKQTVMPCALIVCTRKQRLKSEINTVRQLLTHDKKNIQQRKHLHHCLKNFASHLYRTV